MIANWRVDTELSFSDHRYVMYELALRTQKPEPYRNRKKTDWAQYHYKLEEELQSFDDDPIKFEDIDSRTEELTKALKTCFQDACPLRS